MMSRFSLKTSRYLMLLATLGLAITVKAQSDSDLSDVEVSSDRLKTNLVSSLSRLEGNVVLSHQNLRLTSGYAEAYPKTAEQLAKYVLGEQIEMTQTLPGYQVLAKAGKATYTPLSTNLVLEDGVLFEHQQQEQNFTINADSLAVKQEAQTPGRLIASGRPAILTHKFQGREVVIRAEKINWSADNNTAILTQASLDDGTTTFSAKEIEYNTATGSVSASGRGEDRPRYRFNSDDTKEDTSEAKNDT